MENKRAAIYIDGSNLYHKLSSETLKFENLKKFNYRGLAEWLARDRRIVSCRYYVGVIRAKPSDQKGQELRQSQQKLFSHLTSQSQRFTIREGYIMEHKGIHYEKGVDVEMAVDLICGAYDDIYDVAILLSSDTDLIPAIKRVRSLKKEIEYIGFAHQPSLALQRHASLSRLLIKEELQPFVYKDQPKLDL